MTNQPLTNVSELICTRISHDIIGNIGAVCNAVELLEEGDMDFLDDIKSILKTSSEVLSARLKFFRMAFGLNNANLENADMVKSTALAYLKTVGARNYPIDLSLKLQDNQFNKIFLLGLMVVADTMVKGGTIAVEQQGNMLLIQTLNAPSLAEDKISAIEDICFGRVENEVAQYAPVFYLKELLRNMQYSVAILKNGSFGLQIKQ